MARRKSDIQRFIGLLKGADARTLAILVDIAKEYAPVAAPAVKVARKPRKVGRSRVIEPSEKIAG